MSEIMAVIVTTSPDQFLSIVINSSLLTKMRDVSKMIAFWKNDYANKCVNYLVNSPPFNSNEFRIEGYRTFKSKNYKI
jgi:hypothetical protein